MEAGSEEVGKRKRDEMAELEAGLDAATAQPVSRLPGFVSAGVIQQGSQAQAAGPGAVPVSVENPEDINIEEAEVGDGDGGEEIQLEQQPVPVRVFLCQSFDLLAQPCNASLSAGVGGRLQLGRRARPLCQETAPCAAAGP